MSQCPVDTCRREIDTFVYVMCNPCWEYVPAPLQAAVYRTQGRRIASGHAEAEVAAHEAAKLAAVEAASAARTGNQERMDV